MNFIVFFEISIGAIFINNFILARFLGLCPFFGVSKKLSSAMGMGLAVIFVMTMTSLITWPVNTYLLERLSLGYLRTIVFILIIAALVQLVEMALQKFSPLLYQALGIYLPLITTNCAILGVALINADINDITGKPFTFVEAVTNGIMSGMGFTLALILMSGIREKLEFAAIPKPLQGLPIAFITAGLMAVAFLGFSGLNFFK